MPRIKQDDSLDKDGQGSEQEFASGDLAEDDASDDLADVEGEFAGDSQQPFQLLSHPRDFAWELTDPVISRIKGTDDHRGFGTFELNLDRSLAEQLGRFFDSLNTAELTLTNIRRIDDGVEGAYALYKDDRLIYVGKSNAKRGLKSRLARHRNKLSNRQGIGPNQIRFKAAQIYSFSAFNVETLLLLLAREKYLESHLAEYPAKLADYEIVLAEINGRKPHKDVAPEVLQAWREERKALSKPKKLSLKDTKPPELNNSGFGSNDTGVERDTQKTSLFDTLYPLDLESQLDVFELALEKGGPRYHRESVLNIELRAGLDWFKENVPFTFRIDSKSASEQLDGHVVSTHIFAKGSMAEVMRRLSGALPVDWCIAVMKGKVLVSQRHEHKDVQAYYSRGSETRISFSGAAD